MQFIQSIILIVVTTIVTNLFTRKFYISDKDRIIKEKQFKIYEGLYINIVKNRVNEPILSCLAKKNIYHLINALITNENLYNYLNPLLYEQLTSLKDQKIKCLPVNKETAFIFKKEEFKDTYYDEIEVKENTQYQEYNKFDIDLITDISLQQLNECIKKTKNDKKKCYGEVIVFLYQNKDLVDIQKHDFILKGKEKVIAFESSNGWDDTKVIENIYVKK